MRIHCPTLPQATVSTSAHDWSKHLLRHFYSAHRTDKSIKLPQLVFVAFCGILQQKGLSRAMVDNMIQGQLGSLTSSAPSGPSWEAKRDEARLWKILSKGDIGAL